MKAAGAPFEADVSIIDELAPFAWRGKDAFSTWLADFGKDLAKTGATEPLMTLGRASRTDVSGDSAYLVVPAVYTFKAKDGAAMREPGQFAFVLHKAAGGWKIASWAWTGGKLRPAAPAAK
jgi:ketosteroid isomerase-like protein